MPYIDAMLIIDAVPIFADPLFKDFKAQLFKWATDVKPNLKVLL